MILRAALAVVAILASADAQPREIGKAPSAADLVKSLQGPPPYDKSSIWSLVDLGDPNAVPALRGAYERENDYLTKLTIAAGLVSLGDQTPQYLSRLLEAGNKALGNSAPIRVGEDGETPEYRAAFEKWSKGKPDKEIRRLVQTAMSDDLGVMIIVGRTSDPRLSPLFRRGLDSPNQLIVLTSAQALAAIQDTGAIPLIIARCESSKQLAKGIAMMALVYYLDSPSAQAAVIRYLPDESIREEIVRRAKENGPKGVWK